MKDKTITYILLLFAVLMLLIFLTPFHENKASGHIWTLFFIIIGVLAIWAVISSGKNPKGIIERFKNQHIILQILDVVFIMVFVYGIISMNVVSITWILLCLLVLIPIFQWYLKKEE